MSKPLTYADSGVDTTKGDIASKAAYNNAKKTFSSRKGRIGEPFEFDGGFAGALDMGHYLLIQNDDGTGSKSEVAELTGQFDNIGEDLCAMVADDAICVGAEMISLTNTFDLPAIDPEVIESMTASLAKACAAQRIVIPGGEIAEVPGATKKIVWNATGVGIVKKEKFITGKTIQSGQSVIGLKDPMLRSNGFSLARKVLENELGENWHNTSYDQTHTWGQILLTPSKVFHRLLLDAVLGDFDSERKFTVHGIAHITGGGIPGNINRILPPSVGVELNNLHEPHPAIKKIYEIGNLEETECYRTWHSGTAMMLIVEKTDAQTICDVLNQADSDVEAQIVGETNTTQQIKLQGKFSGKTHTFPL